MRQLAPLTGLRGVAAYAVLIAHVVDSGFQHAGVSVFHAFASRLAYFGMSLFFVLSGFVIQYNYAPAFSTDRLGSATYRFFVARFARLYPLYAIGIIATIPYIPIPNFVGHPWTALSFFTLTQSWFNVEMAIFPPDWSVSTEWFFYFAFIPLTFVVARISRPLTMMAVFSLLAWIGLGIAFFYFAAPLKLFGQSLLPVVPNANADVWGWIIYFSPITRLCDFIVGMLAAKIYMEQRLRKRPGLGAWIVMISAPLWCVAVVMVGPITDGPFLGNLKSNFIYSPALGPLLLCVCYYETQLSRILASRAFQFCGEISYSVYVWSFSVLTLLGGYYASAQYSGLAALNSCIKVVVAVGLTTVFAYGSYLAIEVPSRRWLRRVLTRSSGDRVTAVAPATFGAPSSSGAP